MPKRKGISGFLIKWCFSAIALAVSAWIINGIVIESGWALFVAALVIGFLNAFLRPVVLLFTLPINIVTLGLFTFVVNALMILIASQLVSGFVVHGFWSALLASVIMAAVSFVLNSVFE